MRHVAQLACLGLLLVRCSGSRSGGTPAQPGEVVLDRYKGTGLCIVAKPNEDHPSYEKYMADKARVLKLCDDIGLTPVEIIGAQFETVLHGPQLDATSLSRLEAPRWSQRVFSEDL